MGGNTRPGPRILPTLTGSLWRPHLPCHLHLHPAPRPILPTSTAPPAARGISVKGQLRVVFGLCARIPFRVQEGGPGCNEAQARQRFQFCLSDTSSLGTVNRKISGFENKLTDSLEEVARRLGLPDVHICEDVEKETFLSLEPYSPTPTFLPPRAIPGTCEPERKKGKFSYG